jgi:hypothetical protein
MQEPGDRALIYSPGSPVGTAHALVNDTSLTIDFSNSIMEISDDLRKMDLGPLQVMAPVGNNSVPVAKFTYDKYNRPAYEATAGIVTVPLIPGREKLAAAGPLSLCVGGTTLLAEHSYRAIAQIPNLYIDEGDTASASFQIVQNGLPVTSSVSLTLYTLDVNGNVLSSSTVTSDANGVVTFSVPTQTPGITLFVPSFNGQNDNPSGGAFDPQVNTYMYVRVLPADQAIANLPPTWPNVYANVLSNWNAMAPCMDNWLRLNDPAQIKSFAPMLKKLTDPAAFENFRYMPVTRDLTAGARTLLYKFLDAPGIAPFAAVETAAATERRPLITSAPPTTKAAHLSQSMRRPTDQE